VGDGGRGRDTVRVDYGSGGVRDGVAVCGGFVFDGDFNAVIDSGLSLLLDLQNMRLFLNNLDYFLSDFILFVFLGGQLRDRLE
jgi:hypothetical protein